MEKPGLRGGRSGWWAPPAPPPWAPGGERGRPRSGGSLWPSLPVGSPSHQQSLLPQGRPPRPAAGAPLTLPSDGHRRTTYLAGRTRARGEVWRWMAPGMHSSGGSTAPKTPPRVPRKPGSELPSSEPSLPPPPRLSRGGRCPTGGEERRDAEPPVTVEVPYEAALTPGCASLPPPPHPARLCLGSAGHRAAMSMGWGLGGGVPPPLAPYHMAGAAPSRRGPFFWCLLHFFLEEKKTKKKTNKKKCVLSYSSFCAAIGSLLRPRLPLESLGPGPGHRVRPASLRGEPW